MSSIVLKPRRARPALGRHPWVLDSAIDRIEGDPADGDVVDVLSGQGEFIARGIFNCSQPDPRAAVHLGARGEALDEAFWHGRLRAGLATCATQLGYDEPEGAARLVFSEGDALSGLVVDRYADVPGGPGDGPGDGACGWGRSCPCWRAGPAAGHSWPQPNGTCAGPRASSRPSRQRGGQCPRADGCRSARRASLYAVDLAEGQKTGFYLDQRENRRAAAGYSWPAAACWTCSATRAASALAAAAGGGPRGAGRRRQPSGPWSWPGPTPGATAWRTSASSGARPSRRSRRWRRRASGSTAWCSIRRASPAAAPAVDEALRAYHRLNRLALDLFEPGGILVTCSCSGHVRREDFFAMLRGRGPAGRPRRAGARAARGRPRSSRGGHLPGDRVPEVLRLPGGVVVVVSGEW